MKIVVGVLAGLVIGAGGFFFADLFWERSDSLQRISGELSQVNEAILLRQTNKYADLEVITVGTRAAIFYKWQSDDAWGVDFTNWTPDPDFQDGVLTLTVPPLIYFGPDPDLSNERFETRIVNRAVLVDEDERRQEFIEKSMNGIMCREGLAALESENFRALAEQSLRGFFFKRFADANWGDQPVREIEIVFAEADGVPARGDECL